MKLPDGSRLRVPAAWTAEVTAVKEAGMSEGPCLIATAEHLLVLRTLVDDLLRRSEAHGPDSSATPSRKSRGERGLPTSAVRGTQERDDTRGMGAAAKRAKGEGDSAAGGVDRPVRRGGERKKRRSGREEQRS